MSNVNIFLKLKLKKGGNVKGASTVPGHVDEVFLDSFRWGEENTAALGGKGGNCIVRNFEFTKRMCPGSIPLLLACANADPVVEAVISCRGINTTDKVDFLKWTLTDGLVSHYEAEASAKDSAAPFERVSIRFRALSVEYTQGTTLSARLDVGSNTTGN
jgi:type VI secretion system secreted protein Hcp